MSRISRVYAIRLTARVTAVVSLLIFPTFQALAGELPQRWKEGELSVGGHLAVFDTDARADSSQLGRGSDINFEDRLNLEEDVTSLRADGYWRFSPRHRVDQRQKSNRTTTKLTHLSRHFLSFLTNSMFNTSTQAMLAAQD